MKTYTIKELSEMFQMQASTLRYYEEVGILTQVGRLKKQRVYDERHVNRLKTICCFKGTGMSIAQLQRFFSLENEENEHIDDIVELLEQQKHHVNIQLEQLQKDLEHVSRKLNYYHAIKKSIVENSPRPEWSDFKHTPEKAV